jgi:hypothetical protein
MFKYSIDELNYYVKKSQEYESILVSPIQGVYQSDGLIPLEISNLFKKNALILENELYRNPQSNQAMLDFTEDLVSPYLYPLVYGKSYVIEPVNQRENPMFTWIGTGEQIKKEIPEKDIYSFESDEFKSQKFQLLPSDIEVSEEGKIKFLSYINNLHPYEHRDLYGNISSILEKFIPMFENSLTDLSGHPQEMSVDMHDLYEEDLKESESNEINYDNKTFKELKFSLVFEEPENRRIISLKGIKIQVIVKLQNIILTPENPEYEGKLESGGNGK